VSVRGAEENRWTALSQPQAPLNDIIGTLKGLTYSIHNDNTSLGQTFTAVFSRSVRREMKGKRCYRWYLITGANCFAWTEGLFAIWLYHVKKSVDTRFRPVGMMESNLNFDYKSNRIHVLHPLSRFPMSPVFWRPSSASSPVHDSVWSCTLVLSQKDAPCSILHHQYLARSPRHPCVKSLRRS